MTWWKNVPWFTTINIYDVILCLNKQSTHGRCCPQTVSLFLFHDAEDFVNFGGQLQFDRLDVLLDLVYFGMDVFLD